jgi:hypothetical protein
MPIAPLPTPLQHLDGRRFSFYPPIRNAGGNEWLYRRATWSECVVANLETADELSVPRIFIGEATFDEDGSAVVTLNRELVWLNGAVVPYERRVIELPIAAPIAVNDNRATASRPVRLAPVVNIRLEQKSEVRAGKWIGVALVVGVAVLTIVADVARSPTHNRDFFRASLSYLQLVPEDDYSSVIRKLGKPSSDRSRIDQGRYQRVLGYQDRAFSVILTGRSSAEARYAGALDSHGRVLDGSGQQF